MSTPQITAPGPRLTLPSSLRSRAQERARLAVRGREADPSWSRPLLWIVGLLAAVLGFWGLTRNGYGNTYYAEAAQAASRNWTAWITNALDVSGSDSLDKGPLSNLVMGLSGRLLGFSSFSMLLPEALAGVGSVLLLHNLVKRTLGHRAAILAALMLALTPIFVAMSRFNNPDAILLLTEIAAAWAFVRALESGRTRHLLLCGLFVGLAFNTKMLEAYLVVPGLVVTYLIAGKPKLGRRIVQLAAAGVSMFAVSFVWYGAMMLLPAADRPWVGDTSDNSWFSLIFGANGLSRVSGSDGGPGGGFGGATGPLRLFDSVVGGQIAWLLPLAIGGLGLGLWTRRRAPRTDLARSAYLLWGGWGLVCWAIFSFQAGIFHPYYTTLLAPAVAVLAAGGLILAWERARRSVAWAAVLGLALTGTAVFGAVLLGRAAGFVTWLAPVAIALAAASGIALVALRIRGLSGRPALVGRLAGFAMIAGLVGILAGPTSYSLATVGNSLTGSNPLAGPASADSGAGGFGGGGAGGGRRVGGRDFTRPAGSAELPSGTAPPAGAPGAAGGVGGGEFGPGAAGRGEAGGGFGGGAGGGGSVSTTELKYLEAHQGSAKYLVAAVGSQTAAQLALDSGKNVVDMGGFMGTDPTPTLAKLEGLISSGQLHYVLLSSTLGGPGGADGADGGFGGRAGGGGPGGQTSASSTAATTARDAWIKSHGTVVTIPGQTTSTGATLYYFPASAG